MTIAIDRLIDDAKCYEMVRDLRYPRRRLLSAL